MKTEFKDKKYIVNGEEFENYLDAKGAIDANDNERTAIGKIVIFNPNDGGYYMAEYVPWTGIGYEICGPKRETALEAREDAR